MLVCDEEVWAHEEARALRSTGTKTYSPYRIGRATPLLEKLDADKIDRGTLKTLCTDRLGCQAVTSGSRINLEGARLDDSSYGLGISAGLSGLGLQSVDHPAGLPLRSHRIAGGNLSERSLDLGSVAFDACACQSLNRRLAVVIAHALPPNA